METATKRYATTRQGVRDLDHPLPASSTDHHQKSFEHNVGEGERILSVLGGAGLIAAGLMQRSMSGLMLGLIGGALVHRGISGSCQVYSALGLDTSEHHSSEMGEPAYRAG